MTLPDPNSSHGFQAPLHLFSLCIAVALAACGDGTSSIAPPSGASAIGAGGAPLQSSQSDISISGLEQGPSPFIAYVTMQGASVPQVVAVEFGIQPKPGAASKPVHVTYTVAALRVEGNVSGTSIRLPVFGLYANYSNEISIRLDFADASGQTLPISVATPAYVDPRGILDHPTIRRARVVGSELGFDFFVMKYSGGSPVIADTDGEIRWTAPGIANSDASAFAGGRFVIGDEFSLSITTLGLDGSASAMEIHSDSLTSFTHNIDPGRFGLLGEFNAYVTPAGTMQPISNLGATAAEFAPDGRVIQLWDAAAIISEFMRKHGDDPTRFVRYGADWFHINSTTYDRRDDSVILSSRENFVIKLDFVTGDVVWIFGDPTKYWYTFPSLRAKALKLEGDGLYPVGQHALSITADGLLMLFNDGAPSTNQPSGAPVGISRPYSAVSAYAIDAVALAAEEVWRFDYGKTILSPYCSSVYEANLSYLVDYALADGYTDARVVGLDSARNVVFDISWPNQQPCGTSWNAIPISLDQLQIDNDDAVPLRR